MFIDKDVDICGVKPSLLKKFFKKNLVFSTIDAMKFFDMHEPEISEFLQELASEKWISFKETFNYVDLWELCPQAHRLISTKLIKRFPIAIGKKLVEDFVNKAEEINKNENATCYIKKIFVFGSVIQEGNDFDIGDVDLVPIIAKKDMPEHVTRRLLEMERETAPASLSYIEMIFWPKTMRLRELQKVSSKISMHYETDLLIPGIKYKLIYSYDEKSKTSERYSIENAKIINQSNDDKYVKDFEKNLYTTSFKLSNSFACIEKRKFPFDYIVEKFDNIYIIDNKKFALFEAEHKWANHIPLKELSSIFYRDEKIASMMAKVMKLVLADMEAATETVKTNEPGL